MKSQISIWANQEELKQIELIKERCKRKTFADTLRFLIQQEYEKIFATSVTTVTLEKKSNN